MNPGIDAFRRDRLAVLKSGVALIRSGRLDAANDRLGYNRQWRQAKTAAWHLWRGWTIARQHVELALVEEFLRNAVPPLFRHFDPEAYPNAQALASTLAIECPCPPPDEVPASYRGGVLLFGPTGSGKTRAAFQLLSKWIREEPTLRFHYVSAPVLKRRLVDAARSGKTQTVIDEVLGGQDDVLFVDDLSQTRFSSGFAEGLFEVVDRIHREQRIVVVTVQSKGADLVRRWSADDPELRDTAAAIVRRLAECCHAIHFPAPARPQKGTA